MKVFGLVIMTDKKHRKKQDEMAEAVADRDSANAHIKRLLRYSVELPVLWASVRQAGHEKQIGLIYKRLAGL